MTDITKLTTKHWQHKRNSIGGIASNIDDIRQCINTICSIDKGEIPFMPELGSDIFRAVGENSDDAIDIIKSVLLKELPKQEPRCEITDITGSKDENGKVKMTIYFKEKQTGLTDKTEVYINGRN